MNKKDCETVREELMERLNIILDKYERSNETMGYVTQIVNLERLVIHMEKCYEFDMEFPSEKKVI